MIALAKVIDLLGGAAVLKAPIQDHDQLESAVREGLPFATLRHLIDSGRLSSAEAVRLVVPRTTYGRRANEGVLNGPESERVERLARVIGTAEEVFLDRGKAHRWLRTPHPELRERQPLEVAATELGARRIETMLWQIAHGIAA